MGRVKGAMEPTALKLDPNNSDQTGATDAAGWNGFDLSPDLAFPTLSDDMVQRLRSYGKEENFSGGMTLYTHGDRLIDMFVVLEGGVDVYLPSQDGQSKVTGRFRKNAFTGELNLLNSQRAVVEARTVGESRLLRVPHNEIHRLMRAEGDIANLIVQATIWRRLAIIRTATSGVVLQGPPDNADMTRLRRFFVRNNFPYRIVEAAEESRRCHQTRKALCRRLFCRMDAR
jgi:thioredoxin reductase (NADPH)